MIEAPCDHDHESDLDSVCPCVCLCVWVCVQQVYNRLRYVSFHPAAPNSLLAVARRSQSAAPHVLRPTSTPARRRAAAAWHMATAQATKLSRPAGTLPLRLRWTFPIRSPATRPRHRSSSSRDHDDTDNDVGLVVACHDFRRRRRRRRNVMISANSYLIIFGRRRLVAGCTLIFVACCCCMPTLVVVAVYLRSSSDISVCSRGSTPGGKVRAEDGQGTPPGATAPTGA